jgi:predicted MFS family arabinose efflux permease
MRTTTWFQTPKYSLDFRYGLSGLLTAPIGYLVLLFLPVYLEVISINLSLNEQQIGWLASTDALGLAIATLLFAIKVKKLNFPMVAFIGVFIAVAANIASIGVSNFNYLCAIRVIAGFGEGLIVAVGISAIGMTKNPNRWFGFYTAVIVLVQVLGIAMVPILYEMWSLEGVFLAMAVFYLLPLSVLKVLPKNSQAFQVNTDKDAIASKSTVSTKIFMYALAGLLCFYIGIGGIWTFISLMGTSAGLTLSYVSQALALSLSAGLIGALYFSYLGDKGKSQILLFSSLIAMALSLWWLIFSLTQLSYFVALCVFSFFWSIAGARLFAVISDVDHSGKYISAAQTMAGAGYIVGPILAASLFNGFEYTGVIAMGTLVFALCFAFITPLATQKTTC